MFVSTCHAADANTTLPGAFAIAQDEIDRRASQGPSSTSATSGVQWDADEWTFEQRFWNALAAGGKSVGSAFDVAMPRELHRPGRSTRTGGGSYDVVGRGRARGASAPTWSQEA